MNPFSKHALRDSLLGVKPRDVVCRGITVKAIDILDQRFPDCVKTDEEFCVTLNAILGGLWPQSLFPRIRSHLQKQGPAKEQEIVKQLASITSICPSEWSYIRL